MVKPKAEVDEKKCLACGGCISVCPQDAISWEGNKANVDKKKYQASLFMLLTANRRRSRDERFGNITFRRNDTCG